MRGSRTTALRAAATSVAVALALALAACGGGSSSNDAAGLISQTFSSSHVVNSGNLQFRISVNPSGSSTLKGPISLSLGGPFQSRGKGKLPESDFTINLSGLGKSGSLGLLSTGTAGYVSVSGTSYQLPQSTFQQLESGFTSAGGGGGVGGLGSFGINPKDWLKNPRIAGHDTIDGTDTTHVAAGIDIPKLLADLNKLLQRTSSSTGSTAVPTISPSSQAKIAARVQNPTVDVWTGSSDKMLRKLSVALTVPITGTTSTELGGVTSAAISLTLQYTSLNQPQTIKAPAGTRPYTEFQQKIRAAVTSLLGITVGAGGAGTSGAGGASGTAGASSTNAPSASGVTAYGQCIQSAGGDVSKMQQCAGLLNGH